MIALVPATIVAAVVGKDGIDALLVASQFILSLVLPFVVLPLVYLTSSDKFMSVPVYDNPNGRATSKTKSEKVADSKLETGVLSQQPLEKVVTTATDSAPIPTSTKPPSETQERPSTGQYPAVIGTKSFRNSRTLMAVGYTIFFCILGADTIAIISLAKQAGS